MPAIDRTTVRVCVIGGEDYLPRPRGPVAPHCGSARCAKAWQRRAPHAKAGVRDEGTANRDHDDDAARTATFHDVHSYLFGGDEADHERVYHWSNYVGVFEEFGPRGGLLDELLDALAERDLRAALAEALGEASRRLMESHPGGSRMGAARREGRHPFGEDADPDEGDEPDPFGGGYGIEGPGAFDPSRIGATTETATLAALLRAAAYDAGSTTGDTAELWRASNAFEYATHRPRRLALGVIGADDRPAEPYERRALPARPKRDVVRVTVPWEDDADALDVPLGPVCPTCHLEMPLAGACCD